MKSHRSYTPDPGAIVWKILWPLLIVDGIMWIWYAERPRMAAVWFAVFLVSLFYVRRG
jgi:hypothetical protein